MDIREDLIVPLYKDTVETIVALSSVEQLASDRPALEALESMLNVRAILFPLAFPDLP